MWIVKGYLSKRFPAPSTFSKSHLGDVLTVERVIEAHRTVPCHSSWSEAPCSRITQFFIRSVPNQSRLSSFLYSIMCEENAGDNRLECDASTRIIALSNNSELLIAEFVLFHRGTSRNNFHISTIPFAGCVLCDTYRRVPFQDVQALELFEFSHFHVSRNYACVSSEENNCETFFTSSSYYSHPFVCCREAFHFSNRNPLSVPCFHLRDSESEPREGINLNGWRYFSVPVPCLVGIVIHDSWRMLRMLVGKNSPKYFSRLELWAETSFSVPRRCSWRFSNFPSQSMKPVSCEWYPPICHFRQRKPLVPLVGDKKVSARNHKSVVRSVRTTFVKSCRIERSFICRRQNGKIKQTQLLYLVA